MRGSFNKSGAGPEDPILVIRNSFAKSVVEILPGGCGWKKNLTCTPIDDYKVEFVTDGKEVVTECGLFFIWQPAEPKVDESPARFATIHDQRRTKTNCEPTFDLGFVAW